MKHTEIPIAVVGILIGFVAGFFTSEILRQPDTSPATVATADSGNLPEGHPPVEVMEQLVKLEEHAREHPEHVDVKIQLGNAYYDMGRFDAAQQWYQQALDLQPENVNVMNDLASSYFATGQVEKSVELLERSLKAEPDNAVALQNLGWIRFVSGNYAGAVERWNRLVDVHPEYQHIDEIKQQIENAQAHLRGEHP